MRMPWPLAKSIALASVNVDEDAEIVPVVVLIEPDALYCCGVMPPDVQDDPKPEICPDELTWRHCVEPVIPVSVRLENVPAAGVVPPIAGGVA